MELHLEEREELLSREPGLFQYLNIKDKMRQFMIKHDLRQADVKVLPSLESGLTNVLIGYIDKLIQVHRINRTVRTICNPHSNEDDVVEVKVTDPRNEVATHAFSLSCTDNRRKVLNQAYRDR